MSIEAGQLQELLKLLREKIVHKNLPTIADLSDYRRFLVREVEFWEGSTNAQDFLGHLTQLKNLADQMTSEGADETSVQESLQRSRKALINLNLSFPLSTDRFGPQLKKMTKEPGSNKMARGFLDYLNQKIETLNTQADYFDGVLVAAAANRAELFSSSPLVGHLNLEANQQSLNQTIDAFRLRIEQLGEKARQEYVSKKIECDGSNAALKELIAKHQMDFEVYISKFRNQSDKTIEESREKFEAQMSLQEPANYWADLKSEYSRTGHFFLVLAFACVGAGIFCVRWVLTSPLPLLSETIGSAGSVRSLLLIAFVSTLVLLLLQTSIRMALGAYHLSRDANERRQLTYVFMALVKQGQIEPKEKDVILTALFSRSDTGLLKNDGTPVLPNSLAALIDSLKK